MPRILIIEDQHDIIQILEGFLRQSGFETEYASDGKKGLEMFQRLHPDLVLLDIMLPELDGVEILKQIRKQHNTPVIMLTARSEEIDTLLGLELGADDYISKPFRPLEVVARVKAVLRRGQSRVAKSTPIHLGRVEIDFVQTLIKVDGNVINVTPTEFRLLEHLAKHQGRTFSRNELLESIMPETDSLERVIDVHLGNLRRKLEVKGVKGLIQTVRGMGFRLHVDGA